MTRRQRSPSHGAREEVNDLEVFRRILETVAPFRAGSSIEAHRQWLGERVGAP
jgi:hypothetical protein